LTGICWLLVVRQQLAYSSSNDVFIYVKTAQ
jgi:hypothetical protein